ncbi:diguanylate cyclase [Alteromonas pelagimontana]|uniref:Diguanylate cyclase n=1 Tax=Alteromonas pelagimontana TaxID=1858656 RepID=A0A6M4MF66_9ALTE|nr:hypothetical protein [Alteromonas pelagimontana]QJR80806.1 diguanylate cyclase [Alteromonas pelagimontana]
MGIEAIDHYNIQAPWNALLQTRSFYIDIVGLREGFRPEFRHRGFWLYAHKLPLLHLSEGTEVMREPRSSIDHVAFKCTGLQEIVTRLNDKKIRFRQQGIAQLQQTQLFFRDPLGNGIELNFNEVC